MEQYLDWIIDAHNIAKGFFGGSSDSKITLEAKVYPNIEKLYNFLKENQIVSVSFWRVKEDFNTNKSYDPIVENDFEQDFKVFRALIGFCQTKHHSITETARSFTSIDTTGSTLTYNRAMNKIKEDIRHLPNIRKELMYFLEFKHIIKPNSNIVCEILSKDL